MFVLIFFLSIRHVPQQTTKNGWETSDVSLSMYPRQSAYIIYHIHLFGEADLRQQRMRLQIFSLVSHISQLLSLTRRRCAHFNICLLSANKLKAENRHTSRWRRRQKKTTNEEGGTESAITPSISTRDNLSRQGLTVNSGMDVQTNTEMNWYCRRRNMRCDGNEKNTERNEIPLPVDVELRATTLFYLYICK